MHTPLIYLSYSIYPSEAQVFAYFQPYTLTIILKQAQPHFTDYYYSLFSC